MHRVIAVIGNPETITSGGPLGAIAPAGSA
jgi:hypothetical protein